MKDIYTTKAKESRFNYTAHGIKGKNGESIGGINNNANYLAAWYDFDPVKLTITLTVKGYDRLGIIPKGCGCRNDTDGMTDYFDYDRLIIPATAGAEFLAAAIGYRKHIENTRKKGEKYDYYKREAERFDSHEAAALTLAEQIASGETENGAEIIAERVKAEQERKEHAARENNIRFAAELLERGSEYGHTVEQVGDLVIYRSACRMNIFDGSDGWGREETRETVIVINIKTGDREQVQHAPLAEAYEFYKRFAA